MPMDDNNYSNNKKINYENGNVKDLEDSYYSGLLHSYNIFKRKEIDLYHKTYRFGLYNPYGSVGNGKEVLFFTKPDLHILQTNDSTILASESLNSSLSGIPYWDELYNHRRNTIEMLQLSYKRNGYHDNFNHLLQNQVSSNLDIPSLEAQTIETPTNIYGVGFSYRSSSEASDDTFNFSLEFKDTKWLDTYYFFKTYEEYETLKHHGSIRPAKYYIENKIIHDQFSIYKFILDEDNETILYYAKFYGVMPLSLPRDTFTSPVFDNGITYSVEFRAAFFEDMRPEIIQDFNYLSQNLYNSQKYRIDVYNDVLDRMDGRAGVSAYIENVPSKLSPAGYVYKLRWKGSDTV